MYTAKIFLIAKAMASGAVQKSKYIDAFASTDWTTGDTYDTMTISASDHGRGTDPIIDVYVKSGSNYIKSHGVPNNGWNVSVDTSGNITMSVETGSAFDGKVIVL